MPISNPGTQSQIFDSRPKKVQSAITAVAVAPAIAAYAESTELSPDAVIKFAIAHFLEVSN